MSIAIAESEQCFLRIARGKQYLVTRHKISGKPKEFWTPLSDIDCEVLEAALTSRKAIAEKVVDFPCFNPKCKNTIKMTKTHMEEFFISSKKRYNMVIFPFCCTKCRDAVLAQHGGAIDG
jgi:hypothetical protein